jgi:tetratricopeptide (TPR) repeat protein
LTRAISDFDQAIRIDGKFSVAYNNRADVHIEMNNAELALFDLDEAIKLDPGFAVAFANRAFAWTLLKDDSKAGRDRDAAVRLGVDRVLLEEKMTEFKERAK